MTHGIFGKHPRLKFLTLLCRSPLHNINMWRDYKRCVFIDFVVGDEKCGGNHTMTIGETIAL